MSLPSGEGLKEILRPNRKCRGQLDDVFQSHIALAALYPTDIVPVQPRSLGKFLLGVAALCAQRT